MHGASFDPHLFLIIHPLILKLNVEAHSEIALCRLIFIPIHKTTTHIQFISDIACKSLVMNENCIPVLLTDHSCFFSHLFLKTEKGLL